MPHHLLARRSVFPLRWIATILLALSPCAPLAGQATAPVQFTADSGSFSESVALGMSCPTAGARILYTLDGTDPAAADVEPLEYAVPLTINRPTVVRAVALADGGVPSPVETRSYLFPDQVAGQGADQSARGMPAVWQTLYGIPEALDHRMPAVPNYSRPADYAVDSRIVQTAPAFADDLQTLPVISLVIDPRDLFARERGIYANSSQDWKVPAAVEWLEVNGALNFRTTCSARVMGDLSRREDVNVKHGFMLHFDRDYGPATIPNSIFPDSPVRKVNRIALRSVWGDSWLRDNASRATILRDQFALDSYRAMGRHSPAGRMVHLYLNGLYWGVYQATERPENNWLEALTGFPEADWDIVKGIIFDDGWPIPDGLVLGTGRNGELVSGSIAGWDALFALANSIAGTATNAQLAAIGEHLDIDSFIDYMILNMYAVNWDWPQKNWYAASVRNPAGGAPARKWAFIPWDTEAAFHFPGQSINPDNYTGRNYKGPAQLWRPLRGNPEFAMRFADRLQRHYFGTGAMTPAAAGARFTLLADGLDRAIIGESARWGDAINPASPYTRQQWRTEVARLKSAYFPDRTAASLDQFRGLGLYPSLQAPTFAVPSGEVASGFSVSMSAPAGTLYFTTDGSDPRLSGGAINPAASVYDQQVDTTTLVPINASWRYLDTGADPGPGWTAPAFDDSAWPAGPARLGYGGDGEATTVSYGGDTQNRHIATFFRTRFELADPAAVTEYRLHLVRDDGAVVTLNGTELLRSNMPDGAITHLTRAAQNTYGSAENQVFTYSIPADAFVAGTNTLAVSVHQDQPTSSDLGFALALFADRVTQSALPPLETSTTVKARARSGSTWSALAEAAYLLPQAPMLAITEIMSSSSHAGSIDWFELSNTGTATIDLSGYTWEDSSPRSPRAAFPDGISIAPGESIIISNAQDPAVFRANWGLPPSVQVWIVNGPGLGNGDAVNLYSRTGGLVASRAYPDHRAGVSRFWFTDGTTSGDGFSAAGQLGAWRAPLNGALPGTNVGSPGVATAMPDYLPPRFTSPAAAYGWAGWVLGHENGGTGFLVEVADDNPGDTLTITLESGPPFLRIMPVDNNRALLASIGELQPGQVGEYEVVLRVRDSSPAQLSVSQTLNLTVMRNSSPLILNEYNAVYSSSFLNGGDAVQDGDGRFAPAYSQDSFFGRLAGNGGDWFELVVTGDGGPGTVDLRGWRIEIATGAPVPFIPADVVVLSNHTFWAAVPAGTILTFIENNSAKGGLDSAISKIDRSAGQGWRWTNIWIGDARYIDLAASSGFTHDPLSGDTSGISIDESATQFRIRDAAGGAVFGPAGEGVAPLSGVSATEVFELEGDPHPQVRPTDLATADPPLPGYDDGASGSTFGAPNLYDGNTRIQDFSRYTADPARVYAAWADVFGLGTGQRGHADDPAGDGIPNLLKFLLGGDPLQPGLPQFKLLPPTPGQPRPQLRLPLRDGMDPAFSLSIEWSPDLTVWSLLGPLETVVAQPDSPLPGFTTLTLQPPASSRAWFFRVLGSPAQ
jgi:hypothetical protein